jgi:general secretion pathway protein A
MYLQYFGLQREPFSIAPDPHYLFMSDRHREALAHLLYGVGSGGGFVLLTGEIGAGKTTVCRCFLDQIPEHCNVAYIFNPKLTVPELLHSVCEEFHIPVLPKLDAGTVKDYVDAINRFLLRAHAEGQNNVLIIDEAQNLSPDVLEQLRLLTNLETTERKLLQIILIGQPELRAMLAKPELEQMAQRVIARYHLDALTETETTQYIRHRLSVAGRTGGTPFDKSARHRIHELTGGIPRRINLLSDRALLGAYALGRNRVDADIVDKAASEVFGDEPASDTSWFAEKGWRHRALLTGAGLLAAVALVGGGYWWAKSQHEAPRVAQRVPSPASTASGAVQASAPDGAASEALAAPAGAAAASDPPAVAAASAASTGAAASVPVLATSPAEGPLAIQGPDDLARAFPVRVREEGVAARALAGVWALSLPPGDPCAMAKREQVLCYRGKALSLPMLRLLDRPGVVALMDAENRPVYGLLVALGKDKASVRVGEVTRSIPLDVFAGLWRGDFLTYWRAPQGYAERVDFAKGPAALWLGDQLARAAVKDAGSVATDPTVPLPKRVRSFQVAQGLTPDPAVGPLTFMQLNRALGVAEPRLQSE